MPMNSNLHPEVRINKNGVPVIKHVKDGASPSGSPQRRMYTPPPLSGPKLVTRQAMKDLEATGMKVIESKHGNANLFLLAKRYPETLQTLLRRVQTADEPERRMWEHMITEVPTHEDGRMMSDRVLSTYRQWFSLLPMALDLFPRVEEHNRDHEPRILHARIKSLADSIAQVEHRKQRFAEDDGYLRVKAIMTVIQTDRAAGGRGSINDRDEDIDFIADNMDAIEPIVPELMRRGTTDRGIIQQILSSDTPALNNGIL